MQTFPAFFCMTFELDPEFHNTPDQQKLIEQLDVDGTGLATFAFSAEVPFDEKGTIESDISSGADWFIELSDLEEYGVHDWFSMPDDRVIPLGSYSSYEVKPEKILELMNEWRDRLMQSGKLVGDPGPIVRIKVLDGMTDFDVWQQANLARVVL